MEFAFFLFNLLLLSFQFSAFLSFLPHLLTNSTLLFSCTLFLNIIFVFDFYSLLEVIVQFSNEFLDGRCNALISIGCNGIIFICYFDISGYLLFLNEQMELFPNRQEDAQEYLKFMEAVLHGAEKYGFDYKAF